MDKEIKCKWLNKTYGRGYYICNGFLKTVNEEICQNCIERTDKDE